MSVRWYGSTLQSRTLVFAIALSAAAFGLVQVAHNNLVDRIEHTNQAQLDALQAQRRTGTDRT